MVLTIFAATCVRYLSNSSITWAEELARYCMVWIGFVGASLGIKRNAHIGVAAFVSLLPNGARPYFDLLRAVVIILFNVLVAFFAYQIISSQIATEQVSPALRIPIWVAYAAIPVGMILMTIRCVQGLIKAERRANPEKEPERKEG